MKQEKINRNYEIARERFAELGIDTEAAISSLQKLSLSLHCWQTDDVSGFEILMEVSQEESKLQETTPVKHVI